MKPNFSIYPFMDYTLAVIANKLMPIPMLQRYSHMFYSRNFAVLDSTFRYMFSFELFFSIWCKVGIKSCFCFLHTAIQLFQHHCWKSILFSLQCFCQQFFINYLGYVSQGDLVECCPGSLILAAPMHLWNFEIRQMRQRCHVLFIKVCCKICHPYRKIC